MTAEGGVEDENLLRVSDAEGADLGPTIEEQDETEEVEPPALQNLSLGALLIAGLLNG